MYHHLSQYYDQLFTASEKDYRLLDGFIKPGYLAMDLGCGTGRLTHYLYQKEMLPLGVDLDEKMVEVARNKYPELHFTVSDMTEAFLHSKTYHLITCFGNTLPHLDEKALDHFFMRLKDSLSPDGYAVIQLLNYIPILKNKPSKLKTITSGDITFERFYDYKEHHITFTTKLTNQGTFSEGTTVLYPYTVFDLTHCLENHKLNFQFYGDADLKPFEPEDYYLYIIITKS